MFKIFLVFFLFSIMECHSPSYCYIDSSGFMTTDALLGIMKEQFRLFPESNPFFQPADQSTFMWVIHFAQHLWDGFWNKREFVMEECDLLDDENDNMIFIIPKFHTEEQFYEFLNVFNLTAHIRYFNFITIMMNETTRTKYCTEDTFDQWIDTLVQSISCGIHYYIVTPLFQNLDDATINIQAISNQETEPMPFTNDSQVYYNEYFLNEWNEIETVASRFKLLSDSMNETWVNITNMVYNFYTAYQELIKPLKWSGWHDSNVNYVLNNAIHQASRIVRPIWHQLDVKNFLYSVYHTQEDISFGNANESIGITQDDPNIIHNQRKTVYNNMMVMNEEVSSIVANTKEENLFVSEFPAWGGLAPWENHLFDLSYIVNYLTLLYAIFVVWILGYGVDETKCRPRFPFLPSSQYNCVYPWLVIPGLNFIQRWFPLFDINNPQCESYDTYLLYFNGILELFTPPYASNLIPCLIVNIFLPISFLVAIGILLFVGVLLFLFFWGWYKIEFSRRERMLIREDLVAQVAKLTRETDMSKLQEKKASLHIQDLNVRVTQLVAATQRIAQISTEFLQKKENAPI
ncbi:MAG: hypothetical protein ACTSUE_16710 [Promethearchaeota archaeon]